MFPYFFEEEDEGAELDVGILDVQEAKLLLIGEDEGLALSERWKDLILFTLQGKEGHDA